MKRLALAFVAFMFAGLAYPHDWNHDYDFNRHWDDEVELVPNRICLEPGESQVVRVRWDWGSWRTLRLVDGDGPSGFWASQRSITLPNQITSRDDYIKVRAKEDAEPGRYYFVYEGPEHEENWVVLYVRVGECFSGWRRW